MIASASRPGPAGLRLLVVTAIALLWGGLSAAQECVDEGLRTEEDHGRLGAMAAHCGEPALVPPNR